VWLEIDRGSPIQGQSIGTSRLRSTTGASIVSVASGDSVLVNPGPEAILHGGDRIAVIGKSEQIKSAEKLLRGA
jgi:K+/H+ antiporter YhaU regulatory subunit KhtT